jgi:DNA-binding response OmpR family regulator
MALNSTRVLLIDDDGGIREAVAGYLEEQGAKVVKAHSAVDALGYLDARSALHLTDRLVVVLDLMMPTMDGQAFLAALRTRPACADLPIIVMSAQPWARFEALGTLPQVAAVIKKPFAIAELDAALAKAARRYTT